MARVPVRSGVAKLNRTKWKGQSLRVELAKPSRLTKCVLLSHLPLFRLLTNVHTTRHDTTLTTQHAQRAKLLLEGHKVIPKRTLASGYQFQHPQLEEALADVMSNK